MSTRINDPIEDALYWLENFSNGIAYPNREWGLLLRDEIERLRASQFRWIPVSERHPTKADGNDHGLVLVCGNCRDYRIALWYKLGALNPPTHWAHIPPLPQAPSNTQEQKDEELWLAYCRNIESDWTHKGAPFHDTFLAGLKAAREENK